MRRRRQQRTQKPHYCILVNPTAGGFNDQRVSELITAIRAIDGQYTVIKPDSAQRAWVMARTTVGLRRSRKPLPTAVARRGKVTAIVACGGDGTFNMAARLAAEAEIPIGMVPMGRANNIAVSLLGSDKPNFEPIIKGNYRKVDIGRAGKYSFFGSVGVGFIPSLAEHMADRKPPRFSIGWSRLGNRAAADVGVNRITIKIDRFIFEVSPLMLNVNLLPYSGCLPLSPASIADDGQAEVIFDQGKQMGEFGAFTRQIARGKYVYGEDIQLYRGRVIHLSPVAGRKLYIDGDLVESPDNELPIDITEKAVQVFC
ncbi:hypothetical protein GF420_01015 [candidate division GN15 bacterium]|nr:hypothetical protein [candidate division GN15 bacterium]